MDLLNDVVFYFFIACLGLLALVFLSVIFVYAVPAILIGLFIYLLVAGEYFLALLPIGFFIFLTEYPPIVNAVTKKRKHLKGWIWQTSICVGSSKQTAMGYSRPQYFFRVREILIG